MICPQTYLSMTKVAKALNLSKRVMRNIDRRVRSQPQLCVLSNPALVDLLTKEFELAKKSRGTYSDRCEYRMIFEGKQLAKGAQ